MANNGGIRNYKKLKKELKKVKDAPEKTMKKMTRDAKKQVKGLVASEITKVYGITEADIASKKIGTVRVKGKILDGLEFQYRGRRLTPTGFSMSPTSPNPDGYKLTAEIIRGERATLGTVKKLSQKQKNRLKKNFKGKGKQRSKKSPIMLMPTGNKSEGGTNYIPFQRTTPNRKPIKAIKTLSMPQMVSGDRTSKNISKAVNNLMRDRVEFYLDKYME